MRASGIDCIGSTQKTRINAIFFNRIVLIQVACSSFPCILSLYNTFMWTVSVKAAKANWLNPTATATTAVTNEGTLSGRPRTNVGNHVTFLNYRCTHQRKLLNLLSHLCSSVVLFSVVPEHGNLEGTCCVQGLCPTTGYSFPMMNEDH